MVLFARQAELLSVPTPLCLSESLSWIGTGSSSVKGEWQTGACPRTQGRVCVTMHMCVCLCVHVCACVIVCACVKSFVTWGISRPLARGTGAVAGLMLLLSSCSHLHKH